MTDLPLTSIIIPIHNCLDLTQACLASIQQHTTAPCELILIDDCSDQETATFLQACQKENIHLIRNETRQSYAINNNAGAKMAKGKYLCLLNNDTLLRDNWLTPMIRLMEKQNTIGVLGNKHLFPDSALLHHCGMAFDDDGFPWHLHPNTDPNIPAVNVQRDLQCVTFACVVIPAAVYQQLNGLDESYKNGFEDCDFCLRTLDAGFRVTYTPASTIIHYGQSTPGRQDCDDDNWKLFHSRWDGKIQHDMNQILMQDKKKCRNGTSNHWKIFQPLETFFSNHWKIFQSLEK